MAFSIGHRIKRQRVLLLGLFITSLLVYCTFVFKESIIIPDAINNHISNMYNKSESFLNSKETTIDDFYNEVFEIIISQSPKPPADGSSFFTIDDKCDVGVTGVDFDKLVYSKDRLGKCTRVNDNVFQKLKSSHDSMLKLLPKSFPQGFYKGDGIVMVGGGKFSALALLAIKTLRYRGTTLPIEVFMPQGEQEDQICDHLTTLNARCISLSDILTQSTIDKLDIKGYQLKSLLIMASSFENVLLLDADNNLIENVDEIFNKAPFNETGLVTWPDYWKRTTSPVFYDVAGLKLGDRVRFSIDTKTPVSAYVKGDENLDTDVPLHDRENSIPDGSTESGQLLINKYEHAGTVLLSFYYNFNGPSYFYRLLGQGTAGEGDKDTFLAAAQVLGKPFYQVKRPPGTEGYHKADGFHGVCMLQADPIKDYELFNQIPQQEEETKEVGYLRISKYIKEGSFFLHAHHPKLEPYDLFESKEYLNDDKNHHRMYSNLMKHGVKFDFELLQYVFMNELFCEEGKSLDFKYTHDKKTSQNDVCKFIKEHYDYLVKNSKNFGGI